MQLGPRSLGSAAQEHQDSHYRSEVCWILEDFVKRDAWRHQHRNRRTGIQDGRSKSCTDEKQLEDSAKEHLSCERKAEVLRRGTACEAWGYRYRRKEEERRVMARGWRRELERALRCCSVAGHRGSPMPAIHRRPGCPSFPFPSHAHGSSCPLSLTTYAKIA